jgi:hypothetical protein
VSPRSEEFVEQACDRSVAGRLSPPATGWAKINREKEREEAEFARFPERLEFGQKLCDQAFAFYAPSMAPRDPRP